MLLFSPLRFEIVHAVNNWWAILRVLRDPCHFNMRKRKVLIQELIASLSQSWPTFMYLFSLKCLEHEGLGTCEMNIRCRYGSLSFPYLRYWHLIFCWKPRESFDFCVYKLRSLSEKKRPICMNTEQQISVTRFESCFAKLIDKHLCFETQSFIRRWLTAGHLVWSTLLQRHNIGVQRPDISCLPKARTSVWCFCRTQSLSTTGHIQNLEICELESKVSKLKS